MAPVTTGPKVTQVQSEIRPHLDRNLMVRMQVAIAVVECLPQFQKHLIRGRRLDAGFAEYSHQVRLPSAIHTAPLIPFEALDAQALVVFVVTSFCCLHPYRVLMRGASS